MEINIFDVLMYTCIFHFFFPCVFSTINLTATAYTQTFVSHDDFDGATSYPNNYTRDWLVSAASGNCTITLEFSHCELETGNGKGVCIQDIIYFYDGADSNSSLLQETCCGLQHHNVIQGSGSQVYIKFTTDETLSYTGFSINYMLHGVPTITIPGTYITTAARIQPSTDGSGEQQKLFFILALVISILVILIVATIFTIIYLKKTTQRKSALQPGMKNDVELTTHSQFHVKRRQPHPDLLIYSTPDNFPVVYRKTEDDDDDVFVNKCVIMPNEHTSPSATLNTHRQPTLAQEVSTIFTVGEENNSISNTRNDTKILNSPFSFPPTSTLLEDITQLRNPRRHEIISTMAVSDDGVLTVEYANNVNAMCLNIPEPDTTSTEQKVPITNAASKYSVEEVNKEQVEHQSDISEMQYQKITPELKMNDGHIQTQNNKNSSTDKFHLVSKNLSILSGPWKSSDVSFNVNEDNIQTQRNERSSSTDKFYQTSNALSISPGPRDSSDVSFKVNEDNIQSQLNGRSSSTDKFSPVSNTLSISSGPNKSSDVSLNVNKDNIQTQLNGRASSTDKFYQISNALSISPVPGKSSDVSLKVNEDNVQTQNGRSSSTNKLYPVSNKLPISSGPRKSSDLSLKSPIDTDSLVRKFILPPVETIHKSNEDGNASTTIDYRSRDGYTPGVRRLNPKQFPLLVNTKSPKSSKSPRKIWR